MDGDSAANGSNDVDGAADAPLVGPQPMTILFEDNAGTSIHFKLKATTKLGKAMDAFSARMEKERRTLRFLFEGTRVNNHSIPADLEMEEGDRIEVHMEQIGGGCQEVH